jgi:DNA-directed RNA polymerase subunit RPC12/RpoP
MNTEESKIFRDKDQNISDWSKDTLVKCPTCGKRAILKNEKGVFLWYANRNSEINCSNCGLTINQNELVRYRLELKKNCSNCGEEIQKTIPNLKQKKEFITVRCENCGDTEKHQPRNISNQMVFVNQNGAKDQFFGVSLWLQEEFKSNILWAFNYDHLEYLKNYVSAELRERNGMSMSAKLPQFIKDKKNRSKLLKLIDKMWMEK